MYFMCYSRRAKKTKLNIQKSERRDEMRLDLLTIQVFGFIAFMFNSSQFLLLLSEYFPWHPPSNAYDDDVHSTTYSDVLKCFFSFHKHSNNSTPVRVTSCQLTQCNKNTKNAKYICFALKPFHTHLLRLRNSLLVVRSCRPTFNSELRETFCKKYFLIMIIIRFIPE